MDYQYISLNSIFAKLIRDLNNEFDEDAVIEWSGEALEFIGAIGAYEEAVAFREVKNHQFELPSGLHKIIQIARNNSYTCTPEKICEVIPAVTETACITPNSDGVWLDCNGSPIVAYDIAYYRPFFDLRMDFNGWSNTAIYRDNFTPVRLTTNSFFNSIVLPEDNTHLYKPSTDEYTIIQGSVVRTSFKDGQVALAYHRQVRDKETGYPMIPDNISYKTAIVKYITMKTFEKEFYAGREGAQGKMVKAEQDWHWYCLQAGNAEKMPNGIDEHQNMLDQRKRLVLNNNKYYGFFGNLSKPERNY